MPTGATAGRPYPRGAGQCPRATAPVTVPASVTVTVAVTVTATVTAKVPEKDKVHFLIEVKQSGIFQARNIPASEIETVLAIVCPNILYPYLREVVSDMSIRAGFAPVMLNPVNFEAIYLQQKQQSQAQAPAAGEVVKH